MEYYERIQRSIDYMESHLQESISIDAVAQQAFLSLPHLYRIFPYMTGCTVGSYIRKRRLSLSAQELISTQKRIIDIAFDYQFESQESYIRSFKDMFQITPGEYRRLQPVIAICNKLQLHQMQKKGGLLMQPRIITKQFLLVGAIAEVDLASDFSPIFDDLKTLMMSCFDKIAHKVAPVRRVGIWLPHYTHYHHYQDDNRAKRMYFTGFEVSACEVVPSELVVKALPMSMFAVFRELERDTMTRYAYSEWLPMSGYLLNDALMCDMEIFDDPENMGDHGESDVLIPIQPHHEAPTSST